MALRAACEALLPSQCDEAQDRLDHVVDIPSRLRFKGSFTL